MFNPERIIVDWWNMAASVQFVFDLVTFKS